MLDFLKKYKKDLDLFLPSILIASFVFSGFYVAYVVYAETDAAALTATVSVTLSATVSTDTFPGITAGGAAVFATSTLNVNTNNTSGWNVTLYGNSQGPSDTVMDHNDDASIGITDQTEWVAASATSTHTGATSVQIGSFGNSGDVLAFRVMTASSTNGAVFISTDWWGATDEYVDSATCLWAGIASSTNVTQIGNAGTGSYSASDHLNTVLYHLEVVSTQQGGDYAGDLTYTTVVNP